MYFPCKTRSSAAFAGAMDGRLQPRARRPHRALAAAPSAGCPGAGNRTRGLPGHQRPRPHGWRRAPRNLPRRRRPLGVRPAPSGIPPRAPRGARPPGICRRGGTAALPRRGTSRPSAPPGTRCLSAACSSPVPPSWKRQGGWGRAEGRAAPRCPAPRRPHLPRTVSPRYRPPVTSMAARRGGVSTATPGLAGSTAPRGRAHAQCPPAGRGAGAVAAVAEGSSRRAGPPPCPGPCGCPPWRSSTCRR